MKRVLIAGESWINITTHIKGFDSFQTTTYKEGIQHIRNAFQLAGYEVTHIPNHLAATEFPDTMEKLEQYDIVALSDIGSNNLLLSQSVFSEGIQKSSKLDLLYEFVTEKGKGLLMIGGYMSFAGYDGKARYGETILQKILPVSVLKYDDRREFPAGCRPLICEGKKEHPVLNGIHEWPVILGYNKTVDDRKDAEVLSTVAGDPFIAVNEAGKGRCAVFTTDCAPHWCTEEFLKWEGYNRLWKNMANWLTHCE
ncbi:cytoplasmic protein [Faecalicatena contorta]|uniref:glutamine amidotransferase n=1 Tax=Faecalicatena contorta TaxID=39482 RepID=UPI00195FC3D2|nr:glutamine amidotransferase [Faecalicatena contorta]MBM6686090.1 cytoplasmic protein [Faecalicatena contorta]MBM6710643.1 cytoplasmic protein [Faecalicatena contorta]